MNELIKVFDDAVLPIEVINEKEFMVNVSGIANKYGKRFKDWKDSARVSELLKIRENSHNLKQTELILISGNTQKVHNSMLVSFARFISPEFEVWCDDTIYEILTESKDKEIKRLKEERKLCMVDANGYSSIRGIAQRSDYTESQIQRFFVKLGAIEDSIRPTKYWYMKDDNNGLLMSRGEFQTPYIKLDKAIRLLDQYYK